jgi:signal transduction histidine kinase
MNAMLTHMLEMERQVAVVADFGEVVNQSVGALRGLALAKGQVLRLEVPAQLPLPVRGATVELHGLIDNLLSNAIKYSPRASEIAVRVRAEAGAATVEVSDHGPGLSEEEAKSIFEPFHRGSAQPTAGEASVGLGLSLSRQTATLLGGRLEARSPGPGKGSTFTLTLPLAAPSRPSASPG